MNTYITLNGLNYRTLAKVWKPSIFKPQTARVTLNGELDMTAGVANILKWEGLIVGPVQVPEEDMGIFGTIDDLRNTVKIRNPVSFVDHYGNTYYVAVLGPFDEQSLKNVWDAPDNKIYMRVLLMAVEE